jgi:hypothetical protein
VTLPTHPLYFLSLSTLPPPSQLPLKDSLSQLDSTQLQLNWTEHTFLFYFPPGMASSSRARSSSPFSYRKPSSPYSSASSTTSYNNRLMPRSCSTSASSFFGSRSVTPSRDRSDSMHYGLSNGVGAYGGSLNPVGFGSEELIAEPIDQPRNGGDSISVTIRFRPLR